CMKSPKATAAIWKRRPNSPTSLQPAVKKEPTPGLFCYLEKSRLTLGGTLFLLSDRTLSKPDLVFAIGHKKFFAHLLRPAALVGPRLHNWPYAQQLLQKAFTIVILTQLVHFVQGKFDFSRAIIRFGDKLQLLVGNPTKVGVPKPVINVTVEPCHLTPRCCSICP